MEIRLIDTAKHFGPEVVFRHVHHVFEAGSRTAVLGPNGSGKSTLLQVVAGALVPTAGTVQHSLGGTPLDPERVYRHISIASPYLNLYEDLSLQQTIATHARFKPFRAGTTPSDVARLAHLDAHTAKPVRNLSSGMKQRLKLALAILSDTALLLLDEPTSNLDAQGAAWFHDLLVQHLGARTLLVASNRQTEETFACTASLGMDALK
jgi:ABC-type multidrug transport system ATPase subunit